jgi:hypothetical protein
VWCPAGFEVPNANGRNTTSAMRISQPNISDQLRMRKMRGKAAVNEKWAGSQGVSSRTSPDVEPAVLTSDSTGSRNGTGSGEMGDRCAMSEDNKRNGAGCPFLQPAPHVYAKRPEPFYFRYLILKSTRRLRRSQSNQWGIRKKKERPGATARMLPGRTRASKSIVYVFGESVQ